MIGELFPEECKSASASLAAIINQLMAFTTAKTVANIQGSNSDFRSHKVTLKMQPPTSGDTKFSEKFIVIALVI